MSEDGIFEIAILGRITWQLHSLNNEGTVGNVTEPRNLKIIDPKTGKIVTSDGISGEMLKHIHAEMIWRLEEDKSKFCDACKKLQPSRFDFLVQSNKVKEKNIEKIVEKAIETCEMCDLHGFLIQEPAGNRPSLIEFGWAVALPNSYERDIHTHARHAPGERRREAEVREQMVYHRPTRTGIYAVISVFQPWRIGLNNVTRTYVENVDRAERYKIALKAYRAMFLQTEGAMSTTRLPHTLDFEGIIVYSTSNIPVPKISPLKDNYRDEITNITKDIDENAIKTKKFNGIEEFTAKIKGLIENYKPYKFKL